MASWALLGSHDGLEIETGVFIISFVIETAFRSELRWFQIVTGVFRPFHRVLLPLARPLAWVRRGATAFSTRQILQVIESIGRDPTNSIPYSIFRVFDGSPGQTPATSSRWWPQSALRESAASRRRSLGILFTFSGRHWSHGKISKSILPFLLLPLLLLLLLLLPHPFSL